MLPFEPYIYPDDLLGGGATDVSQFAPWWVFHTRPRAEKSIARKLLKADLAFFLPIYEKKCHGGGRVRSAYVPLFPGYLFGCGDGVREAGLETNQVVQALAVPDQERFREDLVRIHRITQADLELTPEDRLCPGTPVIVTAGALADMTGKVLRRGSQCRFCVEIEFLGRGVSVDLESRLLRPLNGETARTAALQR